MPYLVLEFEAEKDPVKKSDKLKLKMIDAATGKIVELEADCRSVRDTSREPTWAETQTASKALNKDVGTRISREEFQKMEAERDSYRQKLLSAQANIETKQVLIAKLEAEIGTLKDSTLNDKAKLLIGAALDGYIEELAANEQLESYDTAKKIYKHMTGMSWVSGEDEDDDDEEGDQLVDLRGLSDG